MDFIDFPESNLTLGPPQGMEDQVGDLRVHHDTKRRQFISCWQPTDVERELIAQGGNVYLGVLGTGHPPVYVTAVPPFEQPPND